jgi:predicted alpha-1,6-mannanase (GH76 family)
VNTSTLQPASGILASLIMTAAMTITPPLISGDITTVATPAASPHKAGPAARAHKAGAALSPQKAAMAELFLSFNRKTGVIGNTWWQGAVALSTLETYQQATGDTSYSAAIQDAFVPNKSGKFENQANDDTSWWGLAWLQAYEITGSSQYLSMAETDADYVHQDWDSACGGGVWWVRNPRAYKNAIANELFLELTAWLHNTIPGDKKYLRWAEAEWAWFKGSGLINRRHLVNDGLSDSCQNNRQPTWTYNQGVILAGLAELYKATRNSALLAEARRIAMAAIRHLTVGGVLQEPCTGTQCGSKAGGVAQSFKGIFVRGLKVLAVTAKTTKFNSFFRTQARAIEDHDTVKSNQLGMFWSGPAADLTSYSQASAADALVAALNLP